MGVFYCNFTTNGPSADDVIRVLSAEHRSAFVSPTVKGKTVVFEEASDELSEDDIDTVGMLLSRELRCPALAAAVADDDVLLLILYEDGRRTAEYSSRERGHRSMAICRAFGRAWLAPALWVLLHWPYFGFESFRHAVLARLLGIPAWCVGSGYGYITRDELPTGVSSADLRRTGHA